jgi:hypothetical protein
MNGLNGFVHGKETSGQQAQRRLAGANAKMAVPNTGLTHQRQNQQQNSARRQSGGNANQPNIQQLPPQQPQQPPPQQRRSGDGQNGKRDMFDTDVESLDTTTHRGSVIQVADSQKPGHQPFDHQSEADESSSGDEENDGDEYDDEENDDDRGHHYTEGNNNGGAFLGDGNSYPSTTSGPGEYFFNTGIADGRPPLHPNDAHKFPQQANAIHPSRQPAPQPNPQQAYQRAPAQAAAKPAMVKPNIILQSAGLRQQNRSNVTTAVRATGGYQNPSAPLTTPMQSYNRANRDGTPSAFLDPRSNTHPQGNALHQRGMRGAPAPSPHPPVRSVEERAYPAYTDLGGAKQEPLERDQAFEAPIFESKPLVEDYDQPALFGMEYDTLRDESFDHVPRGATPVLPSDITVKPLHERLDYVRGKLGPEDQNSFFQALPTGEWEEAGDWFLDLFGSIIQRTKEARQKKRKLAQGFEKEVEKRYRHVSKRQQHVKKALDQMQQQGETLIPSRTPRPSREPKNT